MNVQKRMNLKWRNIFDRSAQIKRVLVKQVEKHAIVKL